MPPKFIYFDLGNVILHFDHALACRQIAELASLTIEQTRAAVFDSDLQWRYEAGKISSTDFYDAFCRATGATLDYARMLEAASAIFTVNASIVPVVAQLKAAGYRLGILSNTCEAHIDYFAEGQYTLIRDLFDVAVYSCRVGAMKPDRRIFDHAAAQAGVRQDEIFFTDDIAGHVAGARQASFDAVQYIDTQTLVRELRARGVDFNY